MPIDEIAAEKNFKAIRAELYELMLMYPVERRGEIQRVITELNNARDKLLLG